MRAGYLASAYFFRPDLHSCLEGRMDPLDRRKRTDTDFRAFNNFSDHSAFLLHTHKHSRPECPIVITFFHLA